MLYSEELEITGQKWKDNEVFPSFLPSVIQTCLFIHLTSNVYSLFARSWTGDTKSNIYRIFLYKVYSLMSLVVG